MLFFHFVFYAKIDLLKEHKNTKRISNFKLGKQNIKKYEIYNNIENILEKNIFENFPKEENIIILEVKNIKAFSCSGSICFDLLFQIVNPKTSMEDITNCYNKYNLYFKEKLKETSCECENYIYSFNLTEKVFKENNTFLLELSNDYKMNDLLTPKQDEENLDVFFV
jgi:hypothetical protein